MPYTKNDYADFDGFGANTVSIGAKLYDTVTEAVNIKKLEFVPLRRGGEFQRIAER